jgi:PAT family beta-lactamase induction signal transducer AmpG
MRSPETTPDATTGADAGAGPGHVPWSRFATLFALYFVQGLPYGFQVGALPVYLRENGISLTGIGLAGALSLPWIAKILWAPMVDRWHVRRLGRRRSWILPMQLALSAVCVAAAFTEPESRLVPLLGLVLCMNLFAATMDIAVDGLAVDLLAGRSLGYANIAQVVGYKLGALTAGGLLLQASSAVGWRGMFGLMAGLVLAGFGVALALREPAAQRDAEPESVREILRLLGRALATPGVPWLLFFIASYKLGESMADQMFRPFLVDAGFSREQIATWVNTYGMLGSLLGSFAGGLLASRVGLFRGLTMTACVRVVPVLGMLWLALGTPSASAVIGVTVAENFFGGALTTCMFAYMMSRVDRRIGATHFTLFATVEVMGKMLAGASAGVIGDGPGYAAVFGLAVGLSVAFLGLLVPMARHGRAAPGLPHGSHGR